MFTHPSHLSTTPCCASPPPQMRRSTWWYIYEFLFPKEKIDIHPCITKYSDRARYKFLIFKVTFIFSSCEPILLIHYVSSYNIHVLQHSFSAFFDLIKKIRTPSRFTNLNISSFFTRSERPFSPTEAKPLSVVCLFV
jgi:hypothetical protein